MVEGCDTLFWRVAGQNSDRIGKMLRHNSDLEGAKSRELLRNPMYVSENYQASFQERFIRMLMSILRMIIAAALLNGSFLGFGPAWADDESELAPAKIGPSFDPVQENQLDREAVQVGPGDWPQMGWFSAA